MRDIRKLQGCAHEVFRHLANQIHRHIPVMLECMSQKTDRGEARIFDFVHPDFSESCGYMQYLSGDGVWYISLLILLTKWYA